MNELLDTVLQNRVVEHFDHYIGYSTFLRKVGDSYAWKFALVFFYFNFLEKKIKVNRKLMKKIHLSNYFSDHFYTSDQETVRFYRNNPGIYGFERIECFIWQFNVSSKACEE